MLGYALRRLLYMIPVLLGVALLVFLLFNTVGEDPVRVALGQHATAAAIADLRHQWGLDRPLPEPNSETAFFWEAAQKGELHILRCNACGTYVHLPRPACRNCQSTDLAPARVSGRGVVHSFTVTHFPLPGFARIGSRLAERIA